MDQKILIREPGGNKSVVAKIPIRKKKQALGEQEALLQQEFLKELMTAKTEEKSVKDEEVLDLRSDQEVEDELPERDESGEKMSIVTAEKKHVSLKLGIVGSGQAGGRIAEVFSKYGYDVCAINTAQQDLEFLDFDKNRKMLLEMEDKHLGGAGKDLEIGDACLAACEDKVREFLDRCLSDSEAVVLATSGAGGSGSGSAERMCHLLHEMGKPVLVIYILPGAFDDPQGKHNAVTTLSRLANLSQQQVINSLILIDNANIERKFIGASQAAFFEMANQAAVEPLHMFNAVSITPTKYETLDSMDFAKALIESGHCVTFGVNKVTKEEYENDDTAIMQAIIDGLEDGLLASGFDLREAQNVGVLVTAKQSVLENIPYTNIAYMFKYIADEFDSAKSYKGIYAVPSEDDDITVRFIFSGMALPKERIDNLQNEAKKHMEVLEAKKKNTQMKVVNAKDRATDEIDRMIAKAKNKKSGIGKLLGGSSIKRKR
jgi:cell division GTPase FtsZ